MNLSAVVNTYNEEINIGRCLESLVWVDEIIVVDMNSTDRTVAIAKKFTNRIYPHPYTGYVEPARNFGINKANCQWILIVDADEEITGVLAKEIMSLVDCGQAATFYRLPRKNLIFNRWIKHGLWWPDYQIRLFKKNSVQWNEEIHSVPFTKGEGVDLSAEEKYAIVHHNYQAVSQYIERLNRYTSLQADEYIRSHDYRFDIKKLLAMPIDEFLRRYFLAEGYKDGLHGLVLALLQSFSEFVVGCKLWEKSRFKRLTSEQLQKDLCDLIDEKSQEFNYWLRQKKIAKEDRGLFRRFLK